MLLRLRLCPCVLRVIILTIYIEMCLFLQHTNTTNMEGWCLLSLPNTNRLNNKCSITACYPRCLAPIAPHSYVSRWFLALRRFFLPKPKKHRKQPPKPPLLIVLRSTYYSIDYLYAFILNLLHFDSTMIYDFRIKNALSHDFMGRFPWTWNSEIQCFTLSP